MNEPQDKLLPVVSVAITDDLKQFAIVPVPKGAWKLTAPFAFSCLGPNGGQPQIYSAQSGVTASAIGSTLIRPDGSDVLNPQPLDGAVLLQPDLVPNGAAIGVLAGTIEAAEDGAYFTLSTLRGDSNPDVILFALGYRLDPVTE